MEQLPPVLVDSDDLLNVFVNAQTQLIKSIEDQ